MRRASQPIGDYAEWARGVIARAWHSDIGSSDSEVRFLMDMERSLKKFGERAYVSDRQRRWLQDIERRLDRAEAEEDEDPVAKPVDEVLR